MTPLRDAVDEYIALGRGLGFKLRDMATGLTEFAPFLEQHAAPSITTALAVAWAMQPVDHQPSDWAKRLGFVRVFAHQTGTRFVCCCSLRASGCTNRRPRWRPRIGTPR